MASTLDYITGTTSFVFWATGGSSQNLVFWLAIVSVIEKIVVAMVSLNLPVEVSEVAITHHSPAIIGLLIFIAGELVGLAAHSNADIPLLRAVSLDFSMEYDDLCLQGC